MAFFFTEGSGPSFATHADSADLKLPIFDRINRFCKGWKQAEFQAGKRAQAASLNWIASAENMGRLQATPADTLLQKAWPRAYLM